VVGVVDFGWSYAVGPGQAAGVGDGGLLVALDDQAVIGRAGEEQLVGIGGAAGGPSAGCGGPRRGSRVLDSSGVCSRRRGRDCIGGAPLADAAAQFGLITVCGATDRGLLTSAA
jgi:hypothetical protein